MSISILKSRLEKFEENLNQNKDSEVEKCKIDKQIKREKAIDLIISKNNKLIQINIGGKLFKVSLFLLNSEKDSLFDQLYKEETDYNETYFIDRSYEDFDIILDYLRFKKIDFEKYSRLKLDRIYIEAEYYNILSLMTAINNILKNVEFINFESSPKYSNCGTHKLEDLNNKDLNTGICVQLPYFITIEFKYEHEFDKIEIGGYTGNPSGWGASSGASSVISTSTDKISWNEVGKLPTDYEGKIKEVKLKKSVGKYIKFQNKSYLGIGYLKIITV